MRHIYDTKIKIYKNSSRVQLRTYSNPFVIDTDKTDKTKERSGLVLDRLTKVKCDSKTDLLYHVETSPQVKKDRTHLKKVNDDQYKKIDKSNLTRSITSMIDYAENYKTEWKSFITLTFGDNICDIEQANKYFSLWTKRYTNFCKKYGHELKYLGVPEFQKRGAVHYHLLLNVPCGTIFLPNQYEHFYDEKKGRTVYRKKMAYDKKGTNKKLRYCFDVPKWDHGFTGALDFNECDENFDPVAYMCKYMCKDLDERLWGRKKILKSNNVKKPLTIKTLDTGNIKDLYYFLYSLGYHSTTYEFKGNDHKPFCIPFTNEDFQNKEDLNLELVKGIIMDILGLSDSSTFNDLSLPF